MPSLPNTQYDAGDFKSANNDLAEANFGIQPPLSILWYKVSSHEDKSRLSWDRGTKSTCFARVKGWLCCTVDSVVSKLVTAFIITPIAFHTSAVVLLISA